ncbi:MAG TPA: energy transducer TonB [Thermoanaerobaculia bacterium]|jgi:hypothetical protein|nr:energy transducer TonB [Thermoanaerobaculia bacterium]
MKKRCAVFAFASALIALVCPTPPLAAVEPAPPGTVYRPLLMLQWKQRLKVVNEHLLAGKWEKGYSAADSVLGEMIDSITRGEASAPMLAAALFYRAIGEAGLGQVEDASWDFCAAQAIYAATAAVELEPYGEAVAGLDAWRYVDGAPPDTVTPMPVDAQVVPPRRIAGDHPHYPFAKSRACVEDPVAMRGVIDERGRMNCPSVGPNTDPVLAVAALEAVRTWRFEPATRAGKPIAYSFFVGVNFRVERCR